MIPLSPTKLLASGLLAASFFAAPAMAAKTYTPAQLRDMVKTGKYPKQGTPQKQVENVPFKACVDKVKTTVDAVKKEYPAEVLVDTSVMVVAKIWANDGAMTMTCSKPDGTIVLTNASYL